METPAAAARDRRNISVDSGKGTCRSNEHGEKPELKSRLRRKRKIDESNSTTKSDNIQSDLKGSENCVVEGRILRSGRNTPVFLETKCEAENTTLSGKRRKRKTKHTVDKVECKHQDNTANVKKDLACTIHHETRTVNIANKKGKGSTEQSQDNICIKPKSLRGKSTIPRKQNITKGEKQGCSKKQKMSKVIKSKSNNVTKVKEAKIGMKKTSAIERLKLQAFDKLKEKLEKAIDCNSMSVPECAQLLQKITTPNLTNIFYSQPASVDEGSSDSLANGLVGKSLQDILTEREPTVPSDLSTPMQSLSCVLAQSAGNTNHSLSMTNQQHEGISENNFENLLGAPLAQFNATSTSSMTIKDVDGDRTPHLTSEISTLSNITMIGQEQGATNEDLKDKLQSPNLDVLPLLSAGLSTQNLVAPINNKVFSTISGRDPFLAPVLSPISTLLPTPSQNHTSTMASPLVPIFQSHTIPPSSVGAPVLSPSLPQSSTGSGKCQDDVSVGKKPFGFQVWPTQVVPSNNQSEIRQPLICSNPLPTDLNSTNKLLTVSLNQNTSLSNTSLARKLRPILPREPLVTSPITFVTQPQVCGQVSQEVMTCNVKQAVKHLVNTRTKNVHTESNSQQTLQCLPDIQSSFNHKFFKASGKIAEVETFQSNKEMASKEQAIKALLSIGNENQTVRLGEKIGECASKTNDVNKSDDSLVVFDTDKGIFKVDDVTIDPQVNTIGKESYTCGKCGKIFTSLSYLARHIKRVCPDMTQRKWKCKSCEKAFRHPFGLQQHEFTHTGERPHKCTQCPKAFYSSNDLRRHSRIHSGERPYTCKHCGKTFATTISLKTHTFIHTGEKPHRCPHCPKTFATSSKLSRHIVTHSEQRPFACTQCPKTFNRSGDLRRHILNIHTGKLAFDEAGHKIEGKKQLNTSFLASNVNTS